MLGSVTIPGTDRSPPQKYTNVVTVNSAGSNLLLFSCPSTAALISWATALRLASWEKSRLEEIYTAHLLRITHGAGQQQLPEPLVRGRMEGWTRIRLSGQTDWKRLWMVVLQGSSSSSSPNGHSSPHHNPNSNSNPDRPTSPSQSRKRRLSNLFGTSSSEPSSPHAHASHPSDLPPRPLLLFYASPKPKDRKKALLSVVDVSQAFAVYPERPELIHRSTLIKVEGGIGDEEMGGAMRGREGWVLVMPEFEAGGMGGAGGAGGQGGAGEMLRWIIGVL